MIGKISRIIKTALADPMEFARYLNRIPDFRQADDYARQYRELAALGQGFEPPPDNPMWDFAKAKTDGNGIWKWNHYYEIYQRHLSKYVGTPVSLLEVGIYSGGSLEMWRRYFGEQCHIHGVDIEEACRTYAGDGVSVHIGDQADRAFWHDFRAAVPGVDVLVDDGGHTPEQQRVTLEEMLPHLRPGGVYICEDVHEELNHFSCYASRLVESMNAYTLMEGEIARCKTTAFQKSVHSIHVYPYCVVIEKHQSSPDELYCQRHGTVWQPFLGSTDVG